MNTSRRGFLGMLAAVVAAPKMFLVAKAKGPRWRMGFGKGPPGPWIEGDPSEVFGIAAGSFKKGEPLFWTKDGKLSRAMPAPQAFFGQHHLRDEDGRILDGKCKSAICECRTGIV